jgi:hypothetical protein
MYCGRLSVAVEGTYTGASRLICDTDEAGRRSREIELALKNRLMTPAE